MESPQKNIGIITQARTTSSRLPKKVLMKLNGVSVLEHHLKRLEWAQYPIFVATTINKTDDEIVSICEELKIPYYRGSEDDVLARFYECAKKFNLDVIVRVTSDCPLIDGELIRSGIQKFLESNENSYVSNCIERTFPRGFDFEVFSMKSLEAAFKNAHDKFEREHVTPYIRNPEKNKGISLVNIKRSENAGEFRITLDEEDDLKLIKNLIEVQNMIDKKADEIIYFLKSHREIAQINAHVEQKKI